MEREKNSVWMVLFSKASMWMVKNMERDYYSSLIILSMKVIFMIMLFRVKGFISGRISRNTMEYIIYDFIYIIGMAAEQDAWQGYYDMA